MKKSYSSLIRPVFLFIDLLVINLTFVFSGNENFLTFSFLFYINICWLLTAYFTNYYRIFRTTHVTRISALYLKQIILFFLCFFTYFTLFREGIIIGSQFIIFVSIGVNILVFKYATYYLLKWYREKGNNFREVVVVGIDKPTSKIIKFFNSEENFGYKYIGFFSNEISTSDEYLGLIKDLFDFVIKKNIDEIYCSSTVNSTRFLKKISNFSKNHKIEVKIIPDSRDFFNKNFDLEYYGILPVLRQKKLPFELIETHITKRIFDILFSLVIIILIMSWLVPILLILIKLESKGPLFFSQERKGINGKQFSCYKFRSMRLNSSSDKQQVTIDDNRITRIGSFLRKTSLDEIPQFINVLFGDMSVVGPRPHMNRQSNQFVTEVNNYIKRYSVKPGITGLAQISGYRGEIKEKSDIENRVRLDLFYIENWSFFLDLKIIFQTFLKVFKGDDKAY